MRIIAGARNLLPLPARRRSGVRGICGRRVREFRGRDRKQYGRKRARLFGAGLHRPFRLKHAVLSGALLLRNGTKFSEAAGKADLDALLALRPDNAQALNERGYYYQREKNWQAAAADFEKAAESSQLIEEPAVRQKMSAAAQRGLAFTLTERGRWQEAEAIYQKLLKEDPQDERSRHELEYIRQQRAKHPQI